MTNALATVDESSPLLTGAFDAMWRLSESMARAKTLPEHLRGSPADCLRVVEWAYRCRQSPFALADKTYFVRGKLALEGQAVMAMINASPLIEGRLNYEYEGDPKMPATYKCIVSATIKGEDKPRTVPVTLAQGLADCSGAKQRWERDWDQMLAYYGARVWARRHAPEVIMGIYTPDELQSDSSGRVVDITPRHEPQVEVYTPRVESHDAEVQEYAQALQQPKRATIPLLNADGEVIAEYPTWAEWVAGLEIVSTGEHGDLGLINDNWEQLTKVANNAKAPQELRDRAEKLRVARMVLDEDNAA